MRQWTVPPEASRLSFTGGSWQEGHGTDTLVPPFRAHAPEAPIVKDERPEWALWLQQQRQERNWSWRRLARELRQRADKRGWRLPSDDDLIRMMRRWERGEHKPDERYRELLAE